MNNRPKVGVAVLIVKNGKVLLGKRNNAHGDGQWGTPGGHLEFGETWEACARREAKEECGLEIDHMRLGVVTNDIFETEDKHYVTFIMVADYASGTEAVLEPEKMTEWQWFTWDSLPSPLFKPLENAIGLGLQIDRG